MSSHAKLSPSGAHRWMNCPGSLRMSEGIVTPPSVYADEGSAAHHLAFQCLTLQTDAAKYLGRVLRQVKGGWSILQAGAEARSGDFVVDEDMAAAVQVYLDTIYTDRVGGSAVYFEKQVCLSYIDVWGTADCLRIVPGNKLQVYDLKYGSGVAVDVIDNPQLAIYAAAALDGHDVQTVEMIIVQPRARHKDGPVRRWTLSAQELLAWKNEVLVPAVKATEDPEAPLCAGDWCKFCPALPICPQIRELAIVTATADFQTVELPAPERLQTVDLVRVLQSAELLKKWLGAVEAFAQDRMEKGDHFPGFKLVRKRSNRKWRDGAEEALAGQPVFETVLLSPAKAEKVKGLKIDLSQWIEKPEGGLTIAPESDRRDAVIMNAAVDFIDEEDFLK